MEKNDGIRFSEGLQKMMADNRSASRTAILASAFVAAAAVIGALLYVRASRGTIYVMDTDGDIAAAYMGDSRDVRGYEVDNHVRMLHGYLFNLASTPANIEASLEKACELGTACIQDYISILDEKRDFYGRMVREFSASYLDIDSVNVYSNGHGYEAEVFGTFNVLKGDDVYSCPFHSDSELHNTGRSETNPHGLEVYRISVDEFRDWETRRRQ